MDVAYLLAHNFKVHYYAKDAVIYRAHAQPAFVYFIKSGQVKMVTKNHEGDDFIQGIFKEGEYFGEPALLLNKPYLADTIAIEEVALIKVGREAFITHLRESPDFALSLIGVLSERLFYKSMMLEEVGNESAAHRLLQLIDYLIQPLPANAPLKVTRQQLADMTGLRVETVIRTLKVLAKEGKIRMLQGKIIKPGYDPGHILKS